MSLPLGDLKSRSFELPARCREFSVLVEEDGDEDGNSSLCRAREFLLQPDRDASNEKRKFRPWNVKRIVVANKQFWQQAKELDLLNVEALTSSPIPGQKTSAQVVGVRSYGCEQTLASFEKTSAKGCFMQFALFGIWQVVPGETLCSWLRN